jgi:hypothetical protein
VRRAALLPTLPIVQQQNIHFHRRPTVIPSYCDYGYHYADLSLDFAEVRTILSRASTQDTLSRNLMDRDLGVPSINVLRVVALLELALVIGVTAVLNFGIAVLVAICVAPVAAMTIPRSKYCFSVREESNCKVILESVVS